MDNQVVGISAIVGLLLPVVVDYFNNHVVSKKVKYWVSLVTSIVAGFVVVYFAGNFDTTNLLASLGTVFVLSQTVYKTYWKESTPRKTILKKLNGN